LIRQIDDKKAKKIYRVCIGDNSGLYFTEKLSVKKAEIVAYKLHCFLMDSNY
jgi:hypothetical protein